MTQQSIPILKKKAHFKGETNNIRLFWSPIEVICAYDKSKVSPLDKNLGHQAMKLTYVQSTIAFMTM